MVRRSLVGALAGVGFSAVACIPTAMAQCGNWACGPAWVPAAGCAARGCRAACAPPAFAGVVYAPAVACARFYPLQPAYRVEQGPVHNVVVVPVEEPALRLVYLPPRFPACGCYP
jgi:hypothetical protein